MKKKPSRLYLRVKRRNGREIDNLGKLSGDKARVRRPRSKQTLEGPDTGTAMCEAKRGGLRGGVGGV